jgi:hypothetical protein
MLIKLKQAYKYGNRIKIIPLAAEQMKITSDAFDWIETSLDGKLTGGEVSVVMASLRCFRFKVCFWSFTATVSIGTVA